MDTPPFIDPLARILAPQASEWQLPLLQGAPPQPLHAAIASLALGGAERIVLDWAERTSKQTSQRSSQHAAVRIAVLRDAPAEWPVPAGVEVVRFHGQDIEARLAQFAAGAQVVCCHLLTAAQRRALRAGGALTVPVLHNAESGWLEPAAALRDDPLVVAVSQAAAGEYRAAGGRTPCVVVRHFPRAPRPAADARTTWRGRWAIPADAWVIGMVGAVKPQKAYTRALRILGELLDRGRANAFLVIVGGPVGRDGPIAWEAVIAQARRLGVEPHVRLPGFVAEAAQCLPAFDVFLNTSRYEGLSIATLEALASGLPVVASRVGGQGEVGAPALALLDFDAPDEMWAHALVEGDSRRTGAPAWAGFPSERAWSLAYAARPFTPAADGRVLFVTANLNAGGAQRSLVNLALALKGRIPFEIVVTGNSSSDAFAAQLAAAGVNAFRTAPTRDCFDHAEALIEYIVATRPASVCFWNLDAKVKLLLVKWLGHTQLRFVDVSPGGYMFEEMGATRAFQEGIACTDGEYFRRLDHLVHKFRATSDPRVGRRARVIPNGVPLPQSMRTAFSRSARIALCGRIAPSKFVLEAIAALGLLRQHCPDAQLHILGRAEARDRDYALRVASAADAHIVFHGAAFDAPEQLAQFDAMLVLGRHQGCPNTVLESLAAGVPVVANNSGGTREQVIDGKTGLLIDSVTPEAIAAALRRVLEDPVLARRLAVRGRRHVEKKFSMARMCEGYLRLFR